MNYKTNYNTNYVCKYKLDNSLSEFKNLNKLDNYEEEILSDALYRKDILNLFNIETFDETIISNEINKLYEELKKNEELTKCMKKIAGNFMSADEILGLMMLFSYDFLYLLHPCICDFFEKKTISLEKLNELYKKIV
jgi:hypothetical protein